MTKPAAFRQDDLTRVFKAARAAGVRARVELEPGGKMVIMAEPGESARNEGKPPNPWDKDLE